MKDGPVEAMRLKDGPVEAMVAIVVLALAVGGGACAFVPHTATIRPPPSQASCLRRSNVCLYSGPAYGQNSTEAAASPNRRASAAIRLDASSGSRKFELSSQQASMSSFRTARHCGWNAQHDSADVCIPASPEAEGAADCRIGKVAPTVSWLSIRRILAGAAILFTPISVPHPTRAQQAALTGPSRHPFADLPLTIALLGALLQGGVQAPHLVQVFAQKRTGCALLRAHAETPLMLADITSLWHGPSLASNSRWS